MKTVKENQNYFCQRCSVNFSSKRRLSNHLKNLAVETMCYCSTCEVFFSPEGQCSDPIERKIFYCNFCKERLQFDRLKEHICFHTKNWKAKMRDIRNKKNEDRKIARLRKKHSIKRRKARNSRIENLDSTTKRRKKFSEQIENLDEKNKTSLYSTDGTDAIRRLTEYKNMEESCTDILIKSEMTTETDLCIFCSKEIPLCDLEEHENAHRIEEKLRAKQHRNPVRKDGDIICTICGATVPCKELKKHERSHRRLATVICTICGFPAKNIYQHMATHSDERRFACQECGLAFKHKKNLDAHMLVHEAVGKHCCPTCGKAFKTPYNLRVHIRSHQAIKPFACQYCNKTFTTKQSRDNHQKTHITHN